MQHGRYARLVAEKFDTDHLELEADQDTAIKLVSAVDSSLTGKEILIWIKDAETQAKAVSLGWAGDIKPADGDYLAVVHTNIAGQKTDSVMDESVDQTVKILPDGSATATLTVRRTHNGEKGALFNGVRNVDWLRIYVPQGSDLVEARGFDTPDPKLFKRSEEKALAKAVDEVEKTAAAAVAREDFEAAMAEMAKLRKPVDEFFDHVTVNATEAELRANRLRLLNRIRATTLAVADFSKIEG